MKRCSLLLALALLAGACRGGDAGDTIPRETFVAANVALRTAEFPEAESALTREDSARARADSARVREEVLREKGVTVKELQAFIAARRNTPEELAEVWREIAEGVASADSAARAEAAKQDSVAQLPAQGDGSPSPPPADREPPLRPRT